MLLIKHEEFIEYDALIQTKQFKLDLYTTDTTETTYTADNTVSTVTTYTSYYRYYSEHRCFVVQSLRCLRSKIQTEKM